MSEKWENQNTYNNDMTRAEAEDPIVEPQGNPDGVIEEAAASAEAAKETGSQEEKIKSYNPYHMTGESLTEPRWEEKRSGQSTYGTYSSDGSTYGSGESSYGSSQNAYGNSQSSYGSTAGSYEQSQNTYGSTYGAYNYSGTNTSQAAENRSDRRKKRSRKEKKQKNTGGFGKKLGTCVALAVVFGLVAGAVFQGVNLAGNHFLGTDEETQLQLGQTGNAQSDQDAQPVSNTSGVYASVADVVEDTKPSVVAISCVSVQEAENWIFGGNYQQQVSSAGSGIIVGKNDDELLIATNEHVIEDATEIAVTFIDNESAAGTIKGTDENDLAVVAVKLSDIKQETLDQIKVASIGDSDALKEGEQVVAIGNALGQGTAVAAGYVSALNQKITVENVKHEVIQLDIAINQGNSGGALFNMKGELVGINEAKGVVQSTGESADGMGYAIPINQAEPILTNLMNRQTRTEVGEDEVGFLGISGINVNSEVSSMYDLPIGVYVDSVTEGSPAEKAGIQKGDIIKSFDGQKVSDFSSMQSLLTYYKAGETVEVVIARADNGAYTESTLEVTLAARTDFTN